MTPTTLRAVSLTLLACLLWAGNFVVARGAAEWMPPFALAFWRWSLALLFLLPFAWSQRHLAVETVKEQPGAFLIMGLIGVGAFNTLIYLAAQKTTAHNIVLIAATSPLWTFVMARLLMGERSTWRKNIGLALSLTGALLVLTRGDLSALLQHPVNHGDLLVLVAAIGWALHSTHLRFKPKEMRASTFLATIIVIGLAGLTPFYLYEALALHPTPFTPQAWGLYLYVSIAASLVAWYAWNESVQSIGATSVSLLYYSIPIFSSILSILLLAEPLHSYHLYGFALVFSGILVALYGPKRL